MFLFLTFNVLLNFIWLLFQEILLSHNFRNIFFLLSNVIFYHGVMSITLVVCYSNDWIILQILAVFLIWTKNIIVAIIAIRKIDKLLVFQIKKTNLYWLDVFGGLVYIDIGIGTIRNTIRNSFFRFRPLVSRLLLKKSFA